MCNENIFVTTKELPSSKKLCVCILDNCDLSCSNYTVKFEMRRIKKSC